MTTNRGLSFVVAVVLGLAGGAFVTTTAAAADPCAPVVNPIVCENSQPGSPKEEWDILGAGDESIQGFGTDISVDAGRRIDFKIKTDALDFDIDVYRLGWYDGKGARHITPLTPDVAVANDQPDCATNATTSIFDCGEWGVTASWDVPASQVSGVYIAKLTRPDTGGASHIIFVVRNDASTSDLFFQTSDATWQAYNLYGGADFYEGGENGRAYKTSYNRPFATRGAMQGRDFFFSAEYPMVRFLERNGYDLSYTTNVDSDRRGQLISNHKVFVTNGHDEYWSAAQRLHVEQARDAGTHLAFFSGNDVYWRTRYEPSTAGDPTPYRTLTCYKETWAETDTLDPTGEWTGTWRDPRFSPPATGGGNPENALIGTAYMANSTDLPMTVPAAQGKYRLWRNTTVADLTSGLATLAPHTVGYESNEDLDNGFRPAGLIRLSTTTGPTPEYLLDWGKNVAAGTTTHHMTMYRAASDALVFSAGTIQWAWGLDDYHDGDVQPVDERMQQATVNLFADMGVQPATLMGSLDPATASADTTAPTVSITSPAATTTVANGSQVTLSGSASDVGGRVAGVEVSTDAGVSWHPATGTTSWTYSFHTTGLGAQVVQVRAIDDSVNIGAPATRQFMLTGKNTLFGDRVPGTTAAGDATALELGVKFVPGVEGFVTALRFYKGPGNTGTHTGSLWNADGDRLATGIYTGETANGWQTLKLAKPVEVQPGSTYVVSYFAPNGHYAADAKALALTDGKAGPLTVPRSATTGGNGVFGYGAGFPQRSYDDTNYYVDVQFISSASAPPAPVATTPLDNASGVDPAVHPAVVFTKPLAASTIDFTVKDGTGAAVDGTVAYSAATKTATFTPADPLRAATSYTARVTATDTNGIATEEPVTWTFTVDLDPSVKKLFANDATPAVASSDETAPIEVGTRFVPLTSGKIVGLRYYQGPGNTGTHTGTLWSASEQVLRQVTFGPGSGNGWQTAVFSSPVEVEAGGSYVISYFAPNGGYAYTSNFFGSARTNGPLRAPGGANGVFRYGSSGFPAQSYGSANYWVDPLFLPDDDAAPTPVPDGVTVFGAGDLPVDVEYADEDPINVGVRIIPDVDGTITGMRFHKGPGNIGKHVGTLWTADGDPITSATFGGETASGWQSVRFPTPVAVTAGTTYVVSYHTAAGRYSATINGFAQAGVVNVPLRVPQSGGMFGYGTNGFPGQGSNHNFWVDVYFVE
ncbi:DUF4082 domain-containing protein [Symbioplanes lichenis]|uniref:DUF4082 domain-containing protein n=1 Tax=Symbioplanes lichenis TaxID=1629072 RepID=UPI002739BE32|nr:DUF4082 domain-containing protein [Actinoplanes lichenis]